MAENQLETSDESFNDGVGGQETDKKDGSNVSLERKDSLKLKTMKKHGHLRVKEDGQLTYKRTPSSALMLAIQLGIGYSVGRLTAKQERDILMQDFSFVEKVWFPSSGSRETPSHRFQDFKFKSYAPSAFRYFRDLFGMQPSEFLMALSIDELRELSNPGASGSLFFLSADDNFIIKTVQHKEATFLQQLLPGYYMNIHQNSRTLLPKFFGLYCYQSHNVNIRLVVMNNILKTTFRCHQLYDLKGSTFKRKASKAELAKQTPTKKDLDFRNDYSEGITLEANLYDAVIKTIKRDCRVLESFKIMDYSLLLGIHNMDQADREKGNAQSDKSGTEEENPERIARREEIGAALEAIQIDKEGRPLGGIPATSPKGDRLILFIGIIDILQSYRIGKKLEHGWKSLIHDGDSVSVHNPSFYAKRFISFMAEKVFKKGSPDGNRGNAKRRSNRNRTTGSESFIDPAPPNESASQKSKEGKQKVSSVKFSEQAIVYDSDSQEQMVPPPYEAQASLTQKEAEQGASKAEGGAQNDVLKTAFSTESATEGSNVATEGGSDTKPVVIEAESANDKPDDQTGVAMDTSKDIEITIEDYLAKNEAAAQLQDGSHGDVRNGLDEIEVPASCVTGTVAYSNSITVVTSTLSHETVTSRSDGKEAVARVPHSKWSGRDKQEAFSNDNEATREDFELEERNGLYHAHTESIGVKYDVSEGILSKSEDSDIVQPKDVEVTNIDRCITEIVGPNDVKLELPVADSYEVNGVMVTKI